MNNIAIDNNNEIIIDGYSVKRIDGIEQIRQRIRTRLQLFLGEWFLDRNAGVPWLQQILIKNPRFAVVQGVLKQTILRTPGVNELTAFSITDADVERKIVVTFTVNTNFGQITDTIGN